MEKERKSLNAMIFWNTIVFLSSLAVVALLITFVVTIINEATATTFAESWNDITVGDITITEEMFNKVWPYAVAAVSLAAFEGLTTFILSIVILAKGWKSRWCRKYKILWGLLSLFFLGFIGIYIFACCGKKRLKKENVNTVVVQQTKAVEPIFKNPNTLFNAQPQPIQNDHPYLQPNPYWPYGYNNYNPYNYNQQYDQQYGQEYQNDYQSYQYPEYDNNGYNNK